MKGSIINLFRTFIGLAKPERTLANVLTAIAGYLLASQWHVIWQDFLFLVVGLSLAIASASVFNNYTDKDIDYQMPRTKNRALPSGSIRGLTSVIFGVVLAIAGFSILSLTNWLTLGVVAVGYFGYVVLYGVAKRRTVQATLIGTIPGGASIVAGYAAFTNRLDTTAAILFLIMLSWQMVHFYAIGIYRLKDYKAAKIPVMPAKKGVGITKKYMLAYLLIFIFTASLLTWNGYTGYIYLVAILLLSSVWLQKVAQGFTARDDNQWAKEVFKFSLLVLLGMSLLIAIGLVLP